MKKKNALYIKPSIYDTLNESRGISTECNIEANKVAESLRSIVNKSINVKPLVAFGEELGVIRWGENTYRIFDRDIVVKWKYYNFNEKSEMDFYREIISKNDYFDITNNEISITLFGVSGSFDSKNCEGTLAHEIFHNYKYLKPHNAYEKRWVSMGNKIWRSGNLSPETTIISDIIYLISKEEIQAFCQGAYAQIKTEVERGNRKSLEGFISETILYRNFQQLDKSIHDFRNTFDQATYERCCKEIKSRTGENMMTYNKFLHFIENGRKEYLYQIGRLKSLLIDELHINESIVLFEHYFR